MKFTIPIDSLVKLLRVTRRTAASQPNSITSHVLLKAEGSTLTAMTTDLTAATRIAATAKVAEDGAVCLPASTLTAIVARFPTYGDVTVAMKEDGRYKATVTLDKKAYRATIAGLAPSDMPGLPGMDDLKQAEDSTIISLATPGLDKVIRQVSTFTQQKLVTMAQLSGVAVQFTPQAVCMLACDGSRLAWRAVSAAGKLPDQPIQMIMPVKQLREFADLLDDASEAEIGITANQGVIVFRLPFRYKALWAEITSSVIAGTYPDFSGVIPRQNTTRLVVSREGLHEALKLALVLANKYHHIRLQADPPAAGEKNGSLTILARSQEDGDSEQTLAANVSGQSTEILFNGEYLLDWIATVEHATIAVELTTPDKPGLLYPVGVNASTYFYVMMPMTDSGEGETAPEPQAQQEDKQGGKGRGRGKKAPRPDRAPAARPPGEDEDGPELHYSEDETGAETGIESGTEAGAESGEQAGAETGEYEDELAAVADLGPIPM